MNRVLLCFFLLLFGFVFSQDKKQDLASKRNSILKDIEYANMLLESTTQKKEQNIEKIKILSKKIQKRSELIELYEEEIYLYEIQVFDIEKRIIQLESELKYQKELYAEFIRFSYKNYDNYSQALILLASNSINQFYLRKKYIEQISNAREEKISYIVKLKRAIKIELNKIVKVKEQKESTLSKIKQESGLLSSEKINREKNIKILADDEKKLRDLIEEKKKIEKEIQNRLEELIREEAKKLTVTALTPEQKLLSTDFEKNKGKLPWPTAQGIITEKFGEHPHPVIKDLIVRNNGIDITTNTSETVRAVFDGEVSRIFNIKGANYTVIVKHGSYYTVYHNIYDIQVGLGDKIKTKTPIGKVSKEKGGDTSVIHFELYKGKDKLNPEEWICK